MREFGRVQFGGRMSFDAARDEMDRRTKREAEAKERESRQLARAQRQSEIEQRKERARVNRQYKGVQRDWAKRRTEISRAIQDESHRDWADVERKAAMQADMTSKVVKNTLQMSIRQIEDQIRKLQKTYSKKKGNQHINEGVQKLGNAILEVTEKAMSELKRYMISDMKQAWDDFLPKFQKDLEYAEENIGYSLTYEQTKVVFKETASKYIQGILNENQAASYVYRKVDAYSRSVHAVQRIEE